MFSIVWARKSWGAILVPGLRKINRHVSCFQKRNQDLSFGLSGEILFPVPGIKKTSKLVPNPQSGVVRFQVYVVPALRPEPDCSADLQRIPAVPNQASLPNHQLSLQDPTADCPCRAQPQIIPAEPNHQVSLQCSTAKYPCSAQTPNVLAAPMTTYPCSTQPQNIHAVTDSNRRVFLQRPTASITAPPHPTVSLQCSVAKSLCGAQPLQCRTPQMLTFADFANDNARLLCAHQPRGRGGAVKELHAHFQQLSMYHRHTTLCNVLAAILPETLRSLCSNGFKAGMHEVNIVCLCWPLKSRTKMPQKVLGSNLGSRG